MHCRRPRPFRVSWLACLPWLTCLSALLSGVGCGSDDLGDDSGQLGSGTGGFSTGGGSTSDGSGEGEAGGGFDGGEAGGEAGGDGDSSDSGTSMGWGEDEGDATSGDSAGEPLMDFGAPPEQEGELEGDFRVPKASGRYVYSANEATNRVAVIDTATVVIDVVDTTVGPTIVEPIAAASGDAGAVAVLSPRVDAITFIRTDEDFEHEITTTEVAEGANMLLASPDGNWVLAYHDVDQPSEPVGSEQEVTLIHTVGAQEEYDFTVGSHPRSALFDAASTRAYVISDDGVNVIELAELAALDKPPLLAVVEDAAVDPAELEIQISTPRRVALARVHAESWLTLTDLDTGERTTIDMPGYPTDVDISADGSFALAVLPSTGGSHVVEIPLPAASVDDVVLSEVGDEYVGVSALAPDGQAMLLYTTVDPWAINGQVAPNGDPRQRMTILRRSEPGGPFDDRLTLYSEVPIRSAGISPDGASAVLLHDEAAGLNGVAPWPYTLLDLSAAFPTRKLEYVIAEPTTVLFTPAGDRAALAIRDDAIGAKQADIVDLGSFIVDALSLGSPPKGLGYVDATDKIFIAQDHPSGRISFVSADGTVATATGYELSDAVKD